MVFGIKFPWSKSPAKEATQVSVEPTDQKILTLPEEIESKAAQALGSSADVQTIVDIMPAFIAELRSGLVALQTSLASPTAIRAEIVPKIEQIKQQIANYQQILNNALQMLDRRRQLFYKLALDSFQIASQSTQSLFGGGSGGGNNYGGA